MATYEGLTVDYQRLTAEGFKEVDSHWFEHIHGWAIAAPHNPYSKVAARLGNSWDLYYCPSTDDLPSLEGSRDTLTEILELFHSKITS